MSHPHAAFFFLLRNNIDWLPVGKLLHTFNARIKNPMERFSRIKRVMRGYDDVWKIDKYVISKDCFDVMLRNISFCNEIEFVFDDDFLFEYVKTRAAHMSVF